LGPQKTSPQKDTVGRTHPAEGSVIIGAGDDTVAGMKEPTSSLVHVEGKWGGDPGGKKIGKKGIRAAEFRFSGKEQKAVLLTKNWRKAPTLCSH